MKVKKNGKVIIINEKLADRYISMGYEIVGENKEKEDKKKK